MADKLSVYIASFILFIITILVSTLILTSITKLAQTVHHYYRVRDDHKRQCLELELDGVYWKDETLMGLGPDGSYGCYLHRGD